LGDKSLDQRVLFMLQLAECIEFGAKPAARGARSLRKFPKKETAEHECMVGGGSGHWNNNITPYLSS
jgi:hypothetical protein